VDYRNIPVECAKSQNGIVRLSDKNRAEPFFLGAEAPLIFRRFLDCVQTALNNQYLLQFRVIPGGRARLEPIFVGTEVPGVELISADGAWFPAARKDNARFLSQMRLR
jgi:hypothetical protein